jgi:hypothetical protein
LPLAGCSTVSPRQGAILQAASDRYAQVAPGMSREELVHTLGPPRMDGARLLVWKVRYGPGNVELLGVELDGAKRAAIARLHSRVVWGQTTDACYDGLDPNGYAPTPPHHLQQSADLEIRRGYRPTEIQRLPDFPNGYYLALQRHLSHWHFRAN